MITILYEVTFLDGRVFRIFCRGKNQQKRFWTLRNKLVNELKSVTEISKGIYTVKEFEDIFYI